jgi:hypothetical protein
MDKMATNIAAFEEHSQDVTIAYPVQTCESRNGTRVTLRLLAQLGAGEGRGIPFLAFKCRDSDKKDPWLARTKATFGAAVS